jgi:long-chain acyl-CoA synthetase
MNRSHSAKKEDTLPKFLRRNHIKLGSQVAIREKDMGIWKSYSWDEYYEWVKHLSLALVSLGLKAGDRLSILAENKPHAYCFELAAQAVGGIVIGIFADCTPPEIEYYIDHSGTRFVVCQDQEQVDKVMMVKEKVPCVEKVIYWDPKGLWGYREDFLISMDEMIKIGKGYEKTHPDLFELAIDKTEGNDIASFFYSSGTTGRPKAAMVTHKALIGIAESVNEVDHYQENEEYLSFLPLAWVPEQVFGLACSLLFCFRTNFPEKPETVSDNIREIGPQVLFFSPRIWENLNRMVQVKIMDSGWVNRIFYNTALKIGYRMADYLMFNRNPSLWLSIIYFLAKKTIFEPLRDNLGFSKTRIGYSAGSAVSPDVIRYFHGIGVNVKQLYGGTEVGIVTFHRDHDIQPETCGSPLSHAEINFSDDGEILVRTPYMFQGYYKDEEKTNEKIVNGWYHTGDFGYLNQEGHLIVMDRIEDLTVLKSGQKFSPQYCEIRLRYSSYIKDALVIGRETEEFIGVLINIDMGNVSQWAESNRIPYTTFADLSQKLEVIELVRKEIGKINAKLPEYSRIRKFINLHKEFDPDEAEMTRTRKLRRTYVEAKFGDLIKGLFSDKQEIEVVSQVTYQDGRVGSTKCMVRVNKI